MTQENKDITFWQYIKEGFHNLWHRSSFWWSKPFIVIMGLAYLSLLIIQPILIIVYIVIGLGIISQIHINYEESKLPQPDPEVERMRKEMIEENRLIYETRLEALEKIPDDQIKWVYDSRSKIKVTMTYEP